MTPALLRVAMVRRRSGGDELDWGGGTCHRPVLLWVGLDPKGRTRRTVAPPLWPGAVRGMWESATNATARHPRRLGVRAWSEGRRRAPPHPDALGRSRACAILISCPRDFILRSPSAAMEDEATRSAARCGWGHVSSPLVCHGGYFARQRIMMLAALAFRARKYTAPTSHESSRSPSTARVLASPLQMVVGRWRC